MGDLFILLFFFFVLVALLVLVFFQLMCLADLEFDYINPYDSASRINKVIFPEFVTQGCLCLLYLVTGHWVMSLLSVPYLYYNVRLYTRNQHLIDVTEIFNLLNWEKKQRLFKLGYHFCLLFVTLFWYYVTRQAHIFRNFVLALTTEKWDWVINYSLYVVGRMIWSALEADEHTD